ncbi:hypothetical protein ACWDAZ_42370, partial [Streptomyces sp. NPDC001215]
GGVWRRAAPGGCPTVSLPRALAGAPPAAPGTVEAAQVGHGVPDALVALSLVPGVHIAPALTPYDLPVPT